MASRRGPARYSQVPPTGCLRYRRATVELVLGQPVDVLAEHRHDRRWLGGPPMKVKNIHSDAQAASGIFYQLVLIGSHDRDGSCREREVCQTRLRLAHGISRIRRVNPGTRPDLLEGYGGHFLPVRQTRVT